MATYLVHKALLIRSTCVINATRISYEPSDVGMPFLAAVEKPHYLLAVTGGRILFDANNKVSDHKLIFAAPPDFPIAELIGCTLTPNAGPLALAPPRPATHS